jgi:hypothetical protein
VVGSVTVRDGEATRQRRRLRSAFTWARSGRRRKGQRRDYARIIHITTAEIMASAKGDGTSKRSGLLLGGAGAGGGGGGFGGVSFGSSEFRDTILGEATELAVKATTAKLVAAKSRLEL